MNNYTHAVETHQLTKHFSDFVAVDNVDFAIPKGEIFGLLGPNGAGKTTTIRMLCGIMKPSGGTATVLGYDITRNPEAIKKQIGYMSQRFSLYNDLTAFENLQFYAAVYSVPRSERAKNITELIEISGLADHRNELTRNLSGAWRQRLALACAIVHKPPMLFLDEATAGVDPVSRREFWDLIYDMAGQGVSVLATTHYMDEAEYCNTIGMMYRGELIAIAEPDELRASLPGTLIQMECDPIDRAQAILDAMPETLEASVHGAQLHITLTDAKSIKKITRNLSRNQIQVSYIEEVQPSLEDVFIALVSEYRLKAEQDSDVNGQDMTDANAMEEIRK